MIHWQAITPINSMYLVTDTATVSIRPTQSIQQQDLAACTESVYHMVSADPHIKRNVVHSVQANMGGPPYVYQIS